MVSAEITLRNPLGLHLRPAGVLCTEALKFSSSVHLRYEDREVNAKSVLGVLAVGLRFGSKFLVVCEGEDEEKALHDIQLLFEKGLGDELTS